MHRRPYARPRNHVCHGGARNKRVYGAYTSRHPRAGSSGVVPAMLLAAQDEHGFSDEELINALANAAAIGYLITEECYGCRSRRRLPEPKLAPRAPWPQARHASFSEERPRNVSRRRAMRFAGSWAWCATPSRAWSKRPVRSATPRASPTQSYRRKSRLRALATSRTSTKPLKPCGAWAIPFPSSFGKAHSAALPQRLPHAHSAKAA